MWKLLPKEKPYHAFSSFGFTISWDMFVVISYKEFCPLLNFSNEASVTAFPINEPSSLIKCGSKPVPWLLVNCLAEQL